MFKKIIYLLDLILFSLLILIISLLMLFVTIQILGREIGFSVPWAGELSRYLLIWMTFLGMSYGFKKAEHIRITYLINKFSPGIQKIIKYFYFLVCLSFVALMSYSGYKLVYQMYRSRSLATSIRLPLYYVSMIVPISFIISSIYLIDSFLNDEIDSKNVFEEVSK